MEKYSQTLALKKAHKLFAALEIFVSDMISFDTEKYSDCAVFDQFRRVSHV